MSFNQSDRLIRMTKGPLGADEVMMTGFSGREEMSRLFRFQLEFLSTKLDLKPGDIVGKDASIEIDRRDNDGNALPPRHFHGYINRFAAGPVNLEATGKYKYRHYRAEMVPWLWFLTRTSRCFLFFPEKEDKTIFEVIEAVFNRAKSDLHVDPASDLKGINDLKNRKVKHCVQYRETDFDFVSRTMERYGVYYYFKFEDGKHTLVLDMKKNYPACEEAEVSFPGLTGSHTPVDHITDWEHDYEFVSGKWTHTDYNFEKPSTSLKADAPKLPAIDLPKNEKYEHYDYPGDYLEKSDGQIDAKIRQEEKEVLHNMVHGSSLCRTFTPGFKFKLSDRPDAEAVTEHKNSFLLTSVEHSASQPGAETGGQNGTNYHNRFWCVPDSIQYRPQWITPIPTISGVQTAVVVGPGGEEIHTDKYGRVKVQFHWDREGKKDGNSSCWIRVSQVHAGKSFGGIDIPRIGEEVIVDFLEGDPDQPIIVGRVYNAEVMPPFGLPGAKVISGMKSNSTKGGGGYNEFVLDDTKGNELIRVHGQFDMDSTIENDLREHVLHDRSRDVTNNETILIGANQDSHIVANRTETVDKNETITIHGGRTETVDKNESITIHGGRTETVDKDESITISGGRTENVSKNESITIGGGRTESVGKDEKITIGGGRTESVGKDEKISISGGRTETVAKDETVTVSGGRQQGVGKSDKLKVAQSLLVDAGDEIMLKTGSASIHMKKDGTIVIKGKDITIRGSGEINVKASKDVTMKAQNIKMN